MNRHCNGNISISLARIQSIRSNPCLGHLPEAELDEVHADAGAAAGVDLVVHELEGVPVPLDRRRIHHVTAVGANADSATSVAAAAVAVVVVRVSIVVVFVVVVSVAAAVVAVVPAVVHEVVLLSCRCCC